MNFASFFASTVHFDYATNDDKADDAVADAFLISFCDVSSMARMPSDPSEFRRHQWKRSTTPNHIKVINRIKQIPNLINSGSIRAGRLLN